MRDEELTLVFRLDRLDPESAMSGIQAVLGRHGVPFIGFDLYGSAVKLPQVVPRLRKANQGYFSITGHGFEFHLARGPNYQLNFLEIKSPTGQQIPWDEWAGEFIASPDFVMAWVVDVEYQHWQNAYDPLQYTAVGRSYDHLPMKSNELPYPLEKVIIDTSQNPGRRELRQGYIEAVGSVMWLGNPFWELTGADKDVVTSAQFLSVSHPVPSVVRIQAAPSCFTTADGASGELQRMLRSILFPKAASKSRQA